MQQAEHGATVGTLCRKLGISGHNFYRWEKKFGGMAPNEIKKLNQLEYKIQEKFPWRFEKLDSEAGGALRKG